jgi:alpha-L-fucosidase 2
MPDFDPTRSHLSRRDLVRAATAVTATLAMSSLPAFTARGAVPRPAQSILIPDDQATALRYTSPATEAAVMQQGLPVGNGRLGAMVTGDPSHEALFLTDATLWTGAGNASLGDDGQFPYDTDHFGTFGLLAKAYLDIPSHTAGTVSGYRRRLDLSNGLTVVTYQHAGVTYRRETFVSHPDDVLVIRLTQSGGGSHTGSLTLRGTRGEQAAAGDATASFAATLPNGLRYAALVKGAATTGTVSATGSKVTFTGCTEVVLILSGGTAYTPNRSTSYMDPHADPAGVAAGRAAAAAQATGADLLATHVVDYQELYGRFTIDLGTSTAAQQAMDTPERLAARAAPGAPADPELESLYLQFGRYLAITGSRTSLPLNLQGIWTDRNDPPWMADYHTDINVQMNYWLPDRAGLPQCFEAFTDYCLAQYPGWQATTQDLFNDPRNGFRNTSGKIAGWTVAISTGVWGSSGWWWHPAGNAWICNTLYQHYEYTLDRATLGRIYPLLKGACQFWQARLVTTTVTDPATGSTSHVLVDDHDWSPEQGPTDALGITYAQELVWQLFQNYQAATAALGVDTSYAATVRDLQSRLYLPQVSPASGRLEEWMSANDLGETGHRHLSPLVGLFPGDRIAPDTAPVALVDGTTALLTARGTESYGWGLAWRALCWARLKDADRAYALLLSVLRPSVSGGNGSSANLFDMYSQGSTAVFQIDANFGASSAMTEMLVHSRPGVVELLPALPGAWAASGSLTGAGVRGGFTVDFSWTAGRVTTATLHSVGGTTTTVRAGSWSQRVTMASGASVVLTPTPDTDGPAAGVYMIENRRSGKVMDVPGSSTSEGIALVQYGRGGGDNQRWQLTAAGSGAWELINFHSGLAMDVSGGGSEPGTPIIQWSPAHSTNQQWTLEPTDAGWFTVVSVRSGRPIGVAGSSADDLAALELQTATGDLSQQWRFVAA